MENKAVHFLQISIRSNPIFFHLLVSHLPFLFKLQHGHRRLGSPTVHIFSQFHHLHHHFVADVLVPVVHDWHMGCLCG
jgi:hypothetical protein